MVPINPFNISNRNTLLLKGLKEGENDQILPQQWLLRTLFKEANEWFILKVPNRTDGWNKWRQRSLLSFIQIHSRIIKLTKMMQDLRHYNFVDPGTGAHMQTIEHFWGLIKLGNKKYCQTKHQHLDSLMFNSVYMASNS